MELSLLTWNIWFDDRDIIQRTLQLITQIKAFSPDIVALQEVTEPVSLILKKKLPYNFGGFPLNQAYDTLILSKYPITSWERYELPQSHMGRNLLLATIKKETNVQIGTFHLESVFDKTAPIKEQQLKYMDEITSPNTILMGDTNLTKQNPKTTMRDVFQLIDQPNAYKFTYDGKTNPYIKSSKQSRLDRIYVKQEVKVQQFFLTGTQIPASDHYGVFTKIKI